MNIQTNIDSWLYLVKRGAKLIPLHGIDKSRNDERMCGCGDPSCKSPGKHPISRLVPNGLKNATGNETTIREWLKISPFANIGLVTGRAIVLDIDPRHGGDSSLQTLEGEYGRLPHTCRVLTGGGGEHIYFKPPDGAEIRNSAGRLAQGLDVRGIGGYVVAPPSIHISGHSYTWSVDHHPDEVKPTSMPTWLARLLTHGETKLPDRTQHYRDIACRKILEGGRNAALCTITGHLLRRYVDPIVVYELMTAWNNSRCHPPLQEQEVKNVVNSIARAELKRREALNGRRP